MANVRELKESDFDSAVGSGVTLVDFWATWCGPCRAQGPILDKVAEQVAGKANVAKVNVDDERGVAARFGIRGIPALLIFKDGKVEKQFTGLTRADQLVEAIEALL